MKIVCNKTELVKGLQIVSRAIPSKTTMSILEYILIDATGPEVKLVGNDMELGIETVIGCEVVERGYIALSARLFLDVVRKLPDTDVTITQGDNYVVTITALKTEFKLSGRAGEEFNFLPDIARIDGVEISQYSLKSIINQTIFAISAGNDTNRMMSGELLEINGENMRVVALDGHRIAIRKIGLSNSYPSKKVVIPGKTMSELSKILEDSTEKKAEIFFTDKHVMFSFDRTTVISRLIEGNYFNIDQMLSSDYETKITVSRKEITESIDRATLLVKEGDKKPVIFDIKESEIELRINSTLGSMNESIDINKQGKNLMIGFNPKFIMDVLKVIEDDNADIYFVNPKAPCFFKNEEESYNYLILPINFTTV